jgi:hypothetical protein
MTPIPAPKVPKKLPIILSPEEVVRFLNSVAIRKNRAILTTCYAAGSLSVSVPFAHVCYVLMRTHTLGSDISKRGVQSRFRKVTMPRPICFMIMPYSTKPTGVPAGSAGPDKVNPDRLWEVVLRPAIDNVGYEQVCAIRISAF